MDTPDKDNPVELPEDGGHDSGHSEGYYEMRNTSKPEHESTGQEDTPPADEELSAGEETEDAYEIDPELRKTIRRKTLVAFAVLMAGLIIFVLGFDWVMQQPKVPKDDGAYKPLRKVLDFNAKVNRHFLSSSHLAPQYPFSQAALQPRVNGDLGMDTDFDVSDWELDIVNTGSHDTLVFNMDSIKKLPKTEICYNFKCIEGWSQVTRWGGVRLRDFIQYYHLGTRSGKAADPDNDKDLARWVGLQTPDDEYYVGIDMASALHPQTLLCYEMNGKPLPYDQGAPLRLIIPIKYGVKSLKRIGLMYFSDTRPPDYWFEQGYDYDAAL